MTIEIHAPNLGGRAGARIRWLIPDKTEVDAGAVLCRIVLGSASIELEAAEAGVLYHMVQDDDEIRAGESLATIGAAPSWMEDDEDPAVAEKPLIASSRPAVREPDDSGILQQEELEEPETPAPPISAPAPLLRRRQPQPAEKKLDWGWGSAATAGLFDGPATAETPRQRRILGAGPGIDSASDREHTWDRLAHEPTPAPIARPYESAPVDHFADVDSSEGPAVEPSGRGWGSLRNQRSTVDQPAEATPAMQAFLAAAAIETERHFAAKSGRIDGFEASTPEGEHEVDDFDRPTLEDDYHLDGFEEPMPEAAQEFDDSEAVAVTMPVVAPVLPIAEMTEERASRGTDPRRDEKADDVIDTPFRFRRQSAPIVDDVTDERDSFDFGGNSYPDAWSNEPEIQWDALPMSGASSHAYGYVDEGDEDPPWMRHIKKPKPAPPPPPVVQDWRPSFVAADEVVPVAQAWDEGEPADSDMPAWAYEAPDAKHAVTTRTLAFQAIRIDANLSEISAASLLDATWAVVLRALAVALEETEELAAIGLSIAVVRPHSGQERILYHASTAPIAEILTGGELAARSGAGCALWDWAPLGVRDATPPLDGHPLAIAIGTARHEVRLSDGRPFSTPIATLTIVYDGEAIAYRQAANLICRLRDLLEKPAGLIAA